METVIINDPPPPGARVTSLYVWISIRANGDEAIMSADMPMVLGAAGTRHMPLMAGRRDLAEKFSHLARAIFIGAHLGPDPIARIELREFKAG